MPQPTRSSALLFAWSLAATGIIAGCERKSAPSATAESDAMSTPAVPAAEGLRRVYVPAYSHLPRGRDMDRRAQLSVLLSVRNIDATATVTLIQVEYYDTYGHRVRSYLKEPKTLHPLETAEFMVGAHDETGGSGANFMVYWEGPPDAHALLVEAVMLAHLGGGYVAFTSRGVELDRDVDPPGTGSGDPEAVPLERGDDGAADVR